MESINQRSFSVRQLRKQFARKIFAIPEIQREFVWNGGKACALLDSIYRNLPIGTALIWDTNRENSNYLRHTLHILPTFDGEQNPNIWYLIDGQQRLSVLYQVFEGKEITNASGRIVNFGRIYFTLEPQAELRFETLHRPDPEVHFRLTEILSPQWRQHFHNVPRRKLAAIADCRKRILNYRFPVVFVKTKDLEELRETFIRINSRGTPVSAADRAFARATKFRLRHLVHEALTGLKKGYTALPAETVLQTIALAFGARDLGDRAIQAFVKRLETIETVQSQFNKEWHLIKAGIEKAVDYLTFQIGVPNYSYLPSQNLVMTLALFFYHKEGAAPTPKQARDLRKWFWATAVCQRYTGAGFRQNILKDADFFKGLAEGRRSQFKIEERATFTDLLRADYTKRSGLADGFFCLLATHRPGYIKSDGEVPPEEFSSRANRKDKHHIFPRDLLRRNGFTRKEGNRLCNICLIAAEEDQKFGNKPPSTYLELHRHQKHFARAMKSHLIPHNGNGALWATGIRKGYRAFLRERVTLVAKSFESAAGMRLFRDDQA